MISILSVKYRHIASKAKAQDSAMTGSKNMIYF